MQPAADDPPQRRRPHRAAAAAAGRRPPPRHTLPAGDDAARRPRRRRGARPRHAPGPQGRGGRGHPRVHARGRGRRARTRGSTGERTSGRQCLVARRRRTRRAERKTRPKNPTCAASHKAAGELANRAAKSTQVLEHRKNKIVTRGALTTAGGPFPALHSSATTPFRLGNRELSERRDRAREIQKTKRVGGTQTDREARGGALSPEGIAASTHVPPGEGAGRGGERPPPATVAVRPARRSPR